MEKIKELMKKILTKEVIFYIIFGILTTIVNLGSFFVMNDILNWNENISNFIAIILAMTGILNPVVGALVHNAGSVLVIINSALLLKWKNSKLSH